MASRKLDGRRRRVLQSVTRREHALLHWLAGIRERPLADLLRESSLADLLKQGEAALDSGVFVVPEDVRILTEREDADAAAG